MWKSISIHNISLQIYLLHTLISWCLFLVKLGKEMETYTFIRTYKTLVLRTNTMSFSFNLLLLVNREISPKSQLA